MVWFIPERHLNHSQTCGNILSLEELYEYLFKPYSETVLGELESLPGFIIGGHNLNNGYGYADNLGKIIMETKNA